MSFIVGKSAFATMVFDNIIDTFLMSKNIFSIHCANLIRHLRKDYHKFNAFSKNVIHASFSQRSENCKPFVAKMISGLKSH